MELLKSDFYLAFYALAMILSFLKYRWYYDTLLKFLPIIIGYTLLSEVLGVLIRDYEGFQLVYMEGYNHYNQIVFNIYYFIFFLYFYYVFWKTLDADKIIKYGTLSYIFFSLVNCFFQNPAILPLWQSHIIGCLVLVYCSIQYLQKSWSGRRNLLFWISLGLLAFYLLYPVILLTGFLDYEIYQKMKFRKVQHVLIAIMYSCFCYGFFMTKRRVTL